MEINDSVRLARLLKESIRMSVLNTNIYSGNIGAHDFNESCYRVYTNLKNILQESNQNMSIGHRDYKKITFPVEMFIKHDLLRFLIKYHKRLWKRFDVPRKIFYNVGSCWDSDVEKLRNEATDFVKAMDNFLDDNFLANDDVR